MKRAFKQRNLIISVCLFVIFFLSACSKPVGGGIPKEPVPKPPKDKITLRFVNSWGGNDSKADALQEIFDRFIKENPDIEVVNEALFGEDFLPKIKTDFASGNDPDVFGLWPGSDIRTLIKAGKVADLSDVLQKDKPWKDTFGNSMWAYTTFDNRIYGLPVEIIFECLFMNRDLFQRFSLKVPETYEEFIQAVKVFKSNDIIPVAYNSLSEGTYIYQNIAAMLGGKPEIEKPFHEGKVNQCYIDAVNYMKDLYQMGAFPEKAFTMNSKERNVLFKSKKAAMVVQGSWFIGEFANDPTVDIVPFPAIKEGKASYPSMIYGLGCGTFYMSKSAWDVDTKRAASIKLLKALTSKESAVILAEETGMLSNVDISEYNINYNRLAQRGLEMMKSARQLIGPPDSFVQRSVWEKDIVIPFPYVLEGKETAEELWKKAVKAGAAEGSN